MGKDCSRNFSRLIFQVHDIFNPIFLSLRKLAGNPLLFLKMAIIILKNLFSTIIPYNKIFIAISDSFYKKIYKEISTLAKGSIPNRLRFHLEKKTLSILRKDRVPIKRTHRATCIDSSREGGHGMSMHSPGTRIDHSSRCPRYCVTPALRN